MDTRERIARRLEEALQPETLDVIDESDLHKGHHGARPGGETHYRVRVTAAAFRGKSRVEMHRMINAVLADELADGVHALAIEAKAA
ncbi:BolA family transcriptional regulator [Kaistia geumhonensis]|uniref:BolA protein n=1 Tax=Kaistia geumhonensis TaxID=410839 RepID=A0ABU0M874_9HYPH|nr:BolA family protein [Kaistia geumhonensis]MCX5477618.1 BolA family transcriptional regulator [Kaistia geumhonensis]MDQ0517174.1 BolA protein [Kaistia geumhonensis]